MYTQQPTDRINLRVPIAQHHVLKRLSQERGVTVQALIRAGIAAVTGEPDPLRRQAPPKTTT